MIKVFIDGGAGTTGLNIFRRLGERSDVSVLVLDGERRKDPGARLEAIAQSDVAFLCLPDDAAKEICASAADTKAVIIDTSTAHRVDPLWTYGFPELPGQREKIASSRRIANPGCHASGFIALAAPLVREGVLPRDARLSAFSLTGYSGGGKKMIADYEDPERKEALSSPGTYGLSQTHKHLPEMTAICGLAHPPVFCPVVAPYYAGMEVTVPLDGGILSCGIEGIREIYSSCYGGGVIRYARDAAVNGFLYAGAYAGRDLMEVGVYGCDDRMTLVARFDNLGKGACGAAIQNMNIALSLPEETGLIL